MNIWKCVAGALVGLALGLGWGLLLWVPSCTIDERIHWVPLVPDEANMRSSEEFANGVVIFCGLVGLMVGLQRTVGEESRRALSKKQGEEAEAERMRQANLAKASAYKFQQQASLKSIVEGNVASLIKFEALPAHLISAEEFLDQAEQDFAEGVFAPFWDSIEKATRCLGDFDADICFITETSKRRIESAKTLQGVPPPFPVNSDSIRGMAVGNATFDRMRVIVRKAQSNFQFSTIYEQRKTNQILTAGFLSLASAIDGMGRRISSSIHGLSDQISTMSSTLNESLTKLREESQEASHKLLGTLENVAEGVAQIHEIASKNAYEESQRAKKALEMLDNIQRRRIPYPRTPLDGAY